ncbi:hypothetical protein KW846_06425 [Pseudomonas sp. PDM32]|uniref:hypothetical protein n=1 Tax=Pseudomonas sp. PDM32 TaxID=2854768 RepID=UPI001C470A7B|nr:hypothetical protein [Pseudomonas sp. PDM32]MBV7572323.1 hypothetical protein [Pseudomonas sp. PDM32]
MTTLLDQLAELPEPFNEDILDDITGGQPGLLHSRALGKELKVGFTMWPISNPAPGEPERVELYWNDSPVDSKSWTAPVPDSDLFIMVPASYLQDGEHKVRYTVWIYTGQPVESKVLTLTVDSKAPVLNLVDNKLIFPAEVIEGGVTADYLIACLDKVRATVPTYVAQAPGDVVVGKWEDPLDGASQQISSEPLTSANYTQPVELTFTGDLIRNSGEGLRHVTYFVMDRAGNPSGESVRQPVEAALKPLPSPIPLPPPTVPLADIDGLIDRRDAIHPVQVRIHEFDNSLPEDRVVVTVGMTELDPHYLGSQPAFPVDIDVPWLTLKAQYDFEKGGEQDLAVSYKLMRRSLPFLAQDAPPVKLNLSKVGPENPDEPDPLNPDLPCILVRGKVSELDNKLIIDDEQQDAIANLQLYQPANEGEKIRIFWSRTAVRPYVITDADIFRGSVAIPVPWITVRNAGNHPQLRVYYEVFSDQNPNSERSSVTLVDVSVIYESS